MEFSHVFSPASDRHAQRPPGATGYNGPPHRIRGVIPQNRFNVTARGYLRTAPAEPRNAAHNGRPPTTHGCHPPGSHSSARPPPRRTWLAAAVVVVLRLTALVPQRHFPWARPAVLLHAAARSCRNEQTAVNSAERSPAKARTPRTQLRGGPRRSALPLFAAALPERTAPPLPRGPARSSPAPSRRHLRSGRPAALPPPFPLSLPPALLLSPQPRSQPRAAPRRHLATPARRRAEPRRRQLAGPGRAGREGTEQSEHRGAAAGRARRAATRQPRGGRDGRAAGDSGRRTPPAAAAGSGGRTAARPPHAVPYLGADGRTPPAPNSTLFAPVPPERRPLTPEPDGHRGRK